MYEDVKEKFIDVVNGRVLWAWFINVLCEVGIIFLLISGIYNYFKAFHKFS